MLPMSAVDPAGAHRVNHISAGQPVRSGDLGAACLAASQLPALLQKHRPRGPVNTAVHTSAARQPAVRRVDNRVYLHFRNIVSDNP